MISRFVVLVMLMITFALPAVAAQTVDVLSGTLTVTVEDGWGGTGGSHVSKDIIVSSTVAPQVNNHYTVMFFPGSTPGDIALLCVGYKATANLAECYVYCGDFFGPVYAGSTQVTPYGVFCYPVTVGGPGIVSVLGLGVGIVAQGGQTCVQYQNQWDVTAAPPTTNIICEGNAAAAPALTAVLP